MSLRVCRTVAVVSFALVGLPVLSASAEEEPKVVATVNGQPIFSQQLTDELLLRWGEMGLESFIQEIAIEQAAAEAGIEVSDKELEKHALEVQRSIDMRAPETGQSFTLWLAKQKTSLYAFRKRLRIQMLLEEMVKDQVAVTDEEVKDLWERTKDRLRRSEKMHVSHICVTTEEEAKQVRAEILAGKDFAEVARQHSIDPWTKDRGGDYGWIGRGDDPFQKAAFELSQDGELSPPVETKMGWHIIRREEHRPASTPNFEEIRDELRERMLSQRRLQMMNQKRGEILQAAKIERNLEPADLVSTAEGD
jgi:foldase protein PrsA